MADIIVLEGKVDVLEKDVRDVRDRVEELEDEGSSRSDRLLNLEIWKRGNGAKGAEARLQETETAIVSMKECLQRAQSDEAIERIASAAARSIVKGARERDRTAVEKIKAVAAILSPIVAAAAVVIAAIVAAT